MVSNWYEVGKDDIAIDFRAEDVSILAGYNDFGSIYAVLTFDQIREICAKINGRDTTKDND